MTQVLCEVEFCLEADSIRGAVASFSETDDLSALTHLNPCWGGGLGAGGLSVPATLENNLYAKTTGGITYQTCCKRLFKFRIKQL